MSLEGYRSALDNARMVATSRALPPSNRQEEVSMWLNIADMEWREVDKPKSVDHFNWSPPADPDPSVVGARCANCRHFVDNHGTTSGCRQCLCNWRTLENSI